MKRKKARAPRSAQPKKARSAAKESGKNPHAAALGRLGGLKGGHARAQALTAKRRSEIAQKAARARWRRRG